MGACIVGGTLRECSSFGTRSRVHIWIARLGRNARQWQASISGERIRSHCAVSLRLCPP